MLSLAFFVLGLDNTAIAIAIVTSQLHSVGDTGDQCEICDQVTICLRPEQIAMDLCARESTDGDLGDHRDQLETNQRSISISEDLSALHGAHWHSDRTSQIAA